jgi:hypothetical protein
MEGWCAGMVIAYYFMILEVVIMSWVLLFEVQMLEIIDSPKESSGKSGCRELFIALGIRVIAVAFAMLRYYCKCIEVVLRFTVRVIRKFYRWLSAGGFEKFAEMSRNMFIGSLIFVALCYGIMSESNGYSALVLVPLFLVVYPVIAGCGALMGFISLFGKHSKERTACIGLFGNLVPLLILLICVINY